MATRPHFPESLKEIRDIMPYLLAILESDAENRRYAFIWLEETRTMSALCSRVENMASGVDRGIVFRAWQAGINYERSTNLLDKENLVSLAREFRAFLDSQPNTNNASYQPLTLEEERKNNLPEEIEAQIPPGSDNSTRIHFAPPCEIDPYTYKPEDLRNSAETYRKKTLELSESFPEKDEGETLSDVRIMMRLTVKTQVFVDRAKNMSQTLSIPLFYGMGISPKGNMGRTIKGGLGGPEISVPNEEDLIEAAHIPFILDRAERIKPGRYRVITGPDVTGVIAHEAFGHTQEGDTCAKGRSIAPGLREKDIRVGNEHATIMNNAGVYSMDGSRFGTNGSFYFDHEGQFARPQAILDKGYLSTPMTDLFSADRLKVSRTANGKRESWRRPIMTRQTNTYFTPGDKSLDELIALTGDGFLARHAHGGMEDPKGGSLTAGTEYLEEIKNGKLTGRILKGPSGGHVELSDPVFDLLNRIVAKSAVDHPEAIPQNKYGGCGKYHKESVDAGSGGPYILWESVTCG